MTCISFAFLQHMFECVDTVPDCTQTRNLILVLIDIKSIMFYATRLHRVGFFIVRILGFRVHACASACIFSPVFLHLFPSLKHKPTGPTLCPEARIAARKHLLRHPHSSSGQAFVECWSSHGAWFQTPCFPGTLLKATVCKTTPWRRVEEHVST